MTTGINCLKNKELSPEKSKDKIGLHIVLELSYGIKSKVLSQYISSMIIIFVFFMIYSVSFRPPMHSKDYFLHATESAIQVLLMSFVINNPIFVEYLLDGKEGLKKNRKERKN